MSVDRSNSRCSQSGRNERRAGLSKDADNPELTDTHFARAKPFKELFPEQQKAWKRTGPPPVEAPKVHIRLAGGRCERIRATGRGYNARVERVLREALVKGRL